MESPAGMPAEPSPVSVGGCDLQIGDELIFYTGLALEKPYGFTGCQRGMHGTRAAPHQKEAPVHHMAEAYRHYVVGADTDMLEEMAARMGGIFNAGEVDMVYFDGGETMAALGPAWYYVGKVKEAYCRHFGREVLVQGSGTQGYAWHLYSRGNSDDWTALGVKKFLDRHKVPDRVQVYADNFLPAEFGWWGYLTHSPSVDATLPDEIEYGYSKGAGYDTPMGFEVHLRDLEGNGRTDEVLAMARGWEELRLSGKLSAAMREELQTLGQEHTLVQDASGRWNIHRITYGPDHVAKSRASATASWTQCNPYGDQPLRVRIRAKSHQAGYGEAQNIVLTDFNEVEKFRSRTSADQVNISLAVSTGSTPVGSQSWEITGTNAGNRESTWAELEYRYGEPLNLVGHRALGVWVCGDGSGALLNISAIEAGGIMRREQYVDLDFTGWRYCELSEPEAERIYEYPWPHSVKWPTRHLNYKTVGRLAFWLNQIPAQTTVRCQLSPVEALADQPTRLVDPTLKVNQDSLTFPATLSDDEYLEYQGEGRARVYDPNNVLREEVEPMGQATMASGANEIQFGGAATSSEYRARVTIITRGEAQEAAG